MVSVLDYDFRTGVFLEEYGEHTCILRAGRPETLCNWVFVWLDDTATTGLGV